MGRGWGWGRDGLMGAGVGLGQGAFRIDLPALELTIHEAIGGGSAALLSIDAQTLLGNETTGRHIRYYIRVY